MTGRRGEHRGEEEAGSGGMDAVRVDRWLWAARFFKTRGLAAEAIDGGKVEVNGARAKRARLIHRGDRLAVRLGPYLHQVVVQELSERRGPPSQAARLFLETQESLTERERVAFQLKTANLLYASETAARPTKRDRRRLDRFRKDAGWE